MRNTVKITEKEVLKVVDMHQKGLGTVYISKYLGCSQSFVSIFIRAFNGNKKNFNRLHKSHQESISKLSPFYNKGLVKNKCNTTYECRLLFGLIKLKFKPIN